MTRHCTEWQDVSRADGSTARRCARFEQTDEDVLVERGGKGNMGIVVPKMLQGLVDIDPKLDVSGPVTGAVGTVGGTLLASKFGGRLHPFFANNPELSGFVLGSLASLGMGMAVGKGKDRQKVIARGIMTSGLLALAMWATPRIREKLFTGAGPYVPAMGLLTSQSVGALPTVADTATPPQLVGATTDIGVWGSVA